VFGTIQSLVATAAGALMGNGREAKPGQSWRQASRTGGGHGKSERRRGNKRPCSSRNPASHRTSAGWRNRYPPTTWPGCGKPGRGTGRRRGGRVRLRPDLPSGCAPPGQWTACRPTGRSEEMRRTADSNSRAGAFDREHRAGEAGLSCSVVGDHVGDLDGHVDIRLRRAAERGVQHAGRSMVKAIRTADDGGGTCRDGSSRPQANG
jgi:hypothetical protein